MTSGPTLIGSVRRALRLLEVVGSSGRPVTAKCLARALDLNLSTTYHLLRTLEHDGYLLKLEDGYVVGDQLHALGQGNSRQVALARMRPILRALRDQVHAAVYVALYEDGEVTLVDIVDGPRAPRVDVWVGMHDSGHATAMGKCILSCLDWPDRADYLSRHQLADLTPHTITDTRILEERLAERRGYIDDREEYLLGVACVAAPMRTPGVLGALAISMPAHRLPLLDDEVSAVLLAAERAATAFALAAGPRLAPSKSQDALNARLVAKHDPAAIYADARPKERREPESQRP